jgi:hypothetical protein
VKLRADSLDVGTIRVPAQLVTGLVLVACAWPIAWFGNPPFSEHTFFPLWLGYVLSVDGFVLLRSGSSLLTRSKTQFLGLFAASIPLWWMFEVANHFLDNWHYLRPENSGWFSTRIEGSASFSTVIPAVFETAEFYATTRLGRRTWSLVRIRPGNRTLIAISLAGAVMFSLSLAFPRYFFPLVWLGVFFTLDPINALAGQPSIAKQVAQNRWNTVIILFASGLTCGFFWEMWNFWSMPKWIYDITYADRYTLFEMPILGYGGYLPFALEVYAIYHFLRLIIRKREREFLRFDKGEETATESVVDPRFSRNL